MIDDPVTVCEVCGEPVQRVFSPVAVHYKGSGFYTTDYARKGKDSAGNGGKSESNSGLIERLEEERLQGQQQDDEVRVGLGRLSPALAVLHADQR